MPEGEKQVEVLILGGGIAGLWTLRRLRGAGIDVALLTTTPLGAGQTVASQGIIHGGIKYALGGAATRASAAIAAMPGLWRACMDGRPPEGHPALAGVNTLAERQNLWTTPGLLSKIAAAAASKVIRTPVKKLDRTEWPEGFAGASDSIAVYEVAEPVLDAKSVADALAVGQEACIDRVSRVARIEAGGRCVCADVDGAEREIRCERLAMCAGAGNEDLLRLAGIEETLMQRRPLHMVLVRGERLPRLFGHCLGPSNVPRVTITSGRDRAGRSVWYVGGQIAEDGVRRDAMSQVEAARRELAACVPWADLRGAEFAAFRIDRAEGRTAGGGRPDEPVIVERGPVIAVWPTKLAFAPLAADGVLHAVGGTRVGALVQPHRPQAGATVETAPLPWDDPAMEWMR